MPPCSCSAFWRQSRTALIPRIFGGCLRSFTQSIAIFQITCASSFQHLNWLFALILHQRLACVLLSLVCPRSIVTCASILAAPEALTLRSGGFSAYFSR